MTTISISIPHTGGALLVKEGQKVDFKTPLLETPVSTTISINIASHLGIAPSQIFLSIKKVVGENIQKGELLAQKKTLLSKKTFTSPYEGVLKEINHEDGTIVIEISEEDNSVVHCYF